MKMKNETPYQQQLSREYDRLFMMARDCPPDWDLSEWADDFNQRWRDEWENAAHFEREFNTLIGMG